MKLKLLITAWLLFSLPSAILAQDFQTDLKSSYSFTQDSEPKVTLDFKLTNSSPTTFVSSYQLIVPEAGVSGLVLQPKDQKIDKELLNENGQNIFNLKFLNEVVGQGKSREFALEYTDTNLLKKKGASRLINIPALQNSQNFATYQTKVAIPTSFGTPSLIMPDPLHSATSAGQINYTFNQKDNQPIMLQYGREQFLQFTFHVQLQNKTNAPEFQEVILPHDMPGLKVIYANLSPSPSEWKLNEKGEWVGYYLLKTGETLNLTADGYLIFYSIDQDFKIENYFPTLANSFNVWNIDEIPADFLNQATDKIKITTRLDRFGFLPLPGRYQVEINNLTGQNWQNLTLKATDQGQKIKVTPESSNFELLPWQKTVIIVRTSNQKWWQLYQSSDLKLSIYATDGTIIDDVQKSGLTISYLAFTALGIILAAAITAWSLLVARRK